MQLKCKDSPRNQEKSLNLQVRKKRLIDKTTYGNQPVTIEEVSYIVSILIHDFPTCAGSILTPIVVLTAAHCVYDNWRYSIISGTQYSTRGTHHTVNGKLIHPGYDPHVSDVNGIALLHISPPINLTYSPNRAIEIGTGPAAPLTLGTLSGWGRNFHEGLKTWKDFEEAFTKPYISAEGLTVKWRRMAERNQQKGKSLNVYLIDKARLCQELGLSLEEAKEQILIIKWSRDLCNALSAKKDDKG
ncbi:trypsin zeta-like [Belonocnema kinseyi]|uniref:trypsin zeta-like n=1 Tax=Belonocnema kinseyi TaxID=2817044 RepID=UPI00143CE895|nr:trypsin zeta-like [Belonocnema kinseyi]